MQDAETSPQTPPLRSAELTLRTDCGRCGAHVPVNGFLDAVPCIDCGHVTRVPHGVWGPAFQAFDEDRNGSGTTIDGDTTWRWSVAISSPECGCGRPIPLERDDAHTCECGVVTRVIPAQGKSGKRGEANVRRAIAADDGLAIPHEDAPSPVAMTCPNCTGNLRITVEHQRITDCSYCGTQVHLPDAVWRRLHPARTVKRWWAVFQGPSKAGRERRKREAQVDRDARKQSEKAKRAQMVEAARAKAEAENAAVRAAANAERTAAYEAHLRRSLFGLIVGWLVVLGAGAGMAMILALLTYGSLLQLDPALLLGARTALLATGGGLGLLALVAATAAGVWRSRGKVVGWSTGVLMWSALGMIPVAGLAVAGLAGLRMVMRYEPGVTGSGAPTRGAGLLLAAALIGVSGYAQIAMASFFGMTVFDYWMAFLQALPESE